MTVSELSYRITQAFRFEPTQEQAHAISTFCSFMTESSIHPAMIMRGSAGTGKTSLAGAIVRAMCESGQKIVLMAPTGRAAKVFSLNAGHDSFTIHRKIYRQRSFTGDMSGFSLSDNMHRDTLFIIDEASMIANQGISGSTFGSGCLLDDLVRYIYSGDNCRMMLIGDRAQLPPVGEEESPALARGVIESYGLYVYDCDLNEVLRQAGKSGILWNATVIRHMITHDAMTRLPKIRFCGFADIQPVPGSELTEQLNSSYSQVGIDETMVITRSNKRANIYNRGIRAAILDREEILCSGDILMIVKNKYLNAEKASMAKIDFIANGDRAKVVRIRNIHEQYGFQFADVSLTFPDYDDCEYHDRVILDSLTTDATALTHEQQERLFAGVMEDYNDITRKRDRMKALKEDIYFNALQVKYAYAVTCHKAQGGQWAHIYIDQGYMTDDMLTPDYIHWLYTAFTRATDKLFLVNWPDTQIK